MIPFDRDVRGAQRPGLRRRRARRAAAARRTSSVGENFRFGHKRAGRRRPAARRRALRDARRAAARGRRRGRLAPATSAASCSAARSSTPAQLLGAPFALDGEVVHGDKRGRELGFPTANLVPDAGLRHARPRRLRLPRARPATGRGAAAVNVGVRPTFVTGRGELDRGLPARLRRRPLRPAAAHRVPASGCAASGASTRVDALVEQMGARRRATRELCAG